MGRIKLGRTGLVVEKQGFGCLPIQRISKAEAVELLHRAYDGGMNYFDTARAYSDSEEKVGAAFAGMRDRVILATKTAAQTADGFWKDLESSLRALGTDHIDVYQFHNPAFCPVRGERTACMTPPWRPSARERSATSPSLTTAWRWPTRPSAPGCMIRFNSPSATCPGPRNWNWWRNAGRRIWALSP